MAASKTTWQPGQSGNPNGRPRKGLAVSDVLHEIAQEQRAESAPSRLRALLEKLWVMAEEGDLGAIRVILPYLQPEPKEQPGDGAAEFGPITLLEFGTAELEEGQIVRREPGLVIYRDSAREAEQGQE